MKFKARPQQHNFALLLAVAAAIGSGLCSPGAELHKYGDNSKAQLEISGTPWTHAVAGDDWVGTDAAGKPWVCTMGQQQSPINIPSSILEVTAATTAASRPTLLAPEHRTTFQLGSITSNGTNLGINNTGHGIQVFWNSASFVPKISIVLQEKQPLLSNVELQIGNKVQQVPAVPCQFHFHTHSEHLLAGRLYPLEAHIVSVIDQATLPSCPAAGCIVVTAVMFELADDILQDNAMLAPLLGQMPLQEGSVSYLPAGLALDLHQLLPSNSSYVAYLGSLTTPPCTEGVLWMVMTNALKMSLKQLKALHKVVGDYNCTTIEGTTGYTTASQNGSRTNAGRRLTQQGGSPQQRHLLQQGTAAADAAAQRLICNKLAFGDNFRLPQPLNNRAIRVWREAQTSSKGYLSDDATTAAGEGAIAGIVLGTTLGAGLTVLIGYFAYKAYQKNRLKRLYKFSVSNGDMMMVEREVETQWLSDAAGSSVPRPSSRQYAL